ncbi:MAG TPA: 2'-5' RNA ligase family protein, partial [Caulobacter sp.]|nr:2'-5' RNA ligase family protein [Caulobacter sp.]
PDPGAAEAIAQEARRLREALGLRGQPLLTDRFHVTLHHLGDYVGLPGDMVAKGKVAGGALAHAPFEVSFDRAASFANRPGNNPFTLQGGEGVQPLIAFQRALGEKMAGARLKPDKSFTPHITLLYDGQVVPAQDIAPIRWTVNRFVLVQSKLGQTQHIVLQAWDLA